MVEREIPVWDSSRSSVQSGWGSHFLLTYVLKQTRFCLIFRPGDATALQWMSLFISLRISLLSLWNQFECFQCAAEQLGMLQPQSCKCVGPGQSTCIIFWQHQVPDWSFNERLWKFLESNGPNTYVFCHQFSITIYLIHVRSHRVALIKSTSLWGVTLLGSRSC